jgi:hypothetical protein
MADELAEQVLTTNREFRQPHQWEITATSMSPPA